MNERNRSGSEATPGDDGDIEALLRNVGPRDEPSAEMMNEVRQAIHVEWRDVIAQRRRRRVLGFGLAASVAVAALAVAVSVYNVFRPAEQFASVARVEGTLQVGATDGEDWRTLAEGERIAAGAVISTDAGARAALDLDSGISLRIDSSSLLELVAADRIVLDRGAIYVDARPGLSELPLLVETSFGSVRHVGTQYEVRALRHGMEVSIREGRVEVMSPQATSTGSAGERLLVPRNGEVMRSTLAPQDQAWQWTSQIAPAFDIDNQALSSFLDWMARETGRRVVYGSAQLEDEAAQTILRGSIRNLSPQKTLAAVMATTPFEYRESQQTIEIVAGE